VFVPCVLAADFSLEPSVFQFANAQGLSPSEITKAGIISSYCSKIMSSSSQSGGLILLWDGTPFRSDQSLFVAAFCRGWNPDFSLDSSLEELLKSDFSKTLSLEQFNGKDDVCALHKEECDLSRYTSRIFSALMSDIFKVKWANFVGVGSAKSAGKEARINTLFSAYFAMDSSKLSSFLLSYPKTTAMIDNNQQHFVKSLQTLKILNVEKLVSLSCDDNTSLVACGFSGSKDGADQQFITFVYNEYLNYAVFVDFVVNYLERQAVLTKKSVDIEVSSLLQQRKRYQQALQYALDDFKDFVSTYPLHVGLVFYQEKLLQFRDKMSKILPPLYTLYEKLRNVQPVK
jgi:hypothetical protein